jgi:hypothetical protein
MLTRSLLSCELHARLLLLDVQPPLKLTETVSLRSLKPHFHRNVVEHTATHLSRYCLFIMPIAMRMEVSCSSMQWR